MISRQLTATLRRLAIRNVSIRPAILRSPQFAAGSPHRVFSNLSSFAEPHPTLFYSPPVSEEGKGKAEDVDAFLRADIRSMGSILGQIIREHEGKDIFDKVERMRGLAKTWREHGAGRTNASKADADEAFHKLTSFASTLTDKELFAVSRAFTHFLSIANAAEGHHRVRRLSQAKSNSSFGALYPKSDSCGGVMPKLLSDFHSREDILDALSTQTIELVLTAHPTEVNRRTILDKHRRIQEILTKADAYRLSETKPYEKAQLDADMYREIASIWLSDEVSREKPTPEMEAEKNTLVLETVLWKAVPNFLRRLSMTAKEFLGEGLPLDASPIRFASWMGGDRDGNPNVTPSTTREVCLRNRAKAASLFRRDLIQLEGELSLTNCSYRMRAIVGDAGEPYRVFLRSMISKLYKTEMWVEQEINKLHNIRLHNNVDAVTVDEIYHYEKELRDELMMIYQSLVDTGDAIIADGLLTDIIRNISAFGLTLIPLDIRQESDRHEEAIDAVTRYLGLGSFSQWDEETKISWLTNQISSRRPLIRPGIWREHPDIFSSTAIDTLETFQMIAEQHEDSLGAYVISQATSASDVLTVLLLQLDAGVKKPLRVAPLFETLDDLQGAVATMEKLFSLPTYMGIIKGKQEIMIGYSDSAKDAGRLAASWAQYETQLKLAELARKSSIELTFFHGKGGTVGRGGNPQTFAAIMAHAPNTINGRFRVTEQGEMINQNFGFNDRAERTMDIYTAAVLAEKLTERPNPSSTWVEIMNSLSEISCNAYRKVVRGDERFVPYFRAATPEVEFANLNIGSRPSKRNPKGGVESLRAIPWNFAWTQTRFNLPTWLGVGEAINHYLKQSDKGPILREMYRDWGMFRTMVDLVEMVLAKSEPFIAAHYESMLVKDPKASELGNEVRKIHLETEDTILDLTGHHELGENNHILKRALAVRNPYVDCLNILQAETLARIRKSEAGEEDMILKDALLTTITGVANGLGNTG